MQGMQGQENMEFQLDGDEIGFALDILSYPANVFLHHQIGSTNSPLPPSTCFLQLSIRSTNSSVHVLAKRVELG